MPSGDGQQQGRRHRPDYERPPRMQPMSRLAVIRPAPGRRPGGKHLRPIGGEPMIVHTIGGHWRPGAWIGSSSRRTIPPWRASPRRAGARSRSGGGRAGGGRHAHGTGRRPRRGLGGGRRDAHRCGRHAAANLAAADAGQIDAAVELWDVAPSGAWRACGDGRAEQRGRRADRNRFTLAHDCPGSTTTAADARRD